MALEFEASSGDRVYDEVSGFTEPFSMACWFWIDPTAIAAYVVMSYGERGGTSYHSLRGAPLPNFHIEAHTFDGSSSGSRKENIATGQWNHAVGLVASSSSRQLAYNGVLETANTDSKSVNPDRFSVGVSGDSTPFGDLKGKTAEMAAWNVVLTQPEIATLAAGYSPLFVRPAHLRYYRRGIRGNDGELTGHVTGGSFGTPLTVPHPRIIYPSRPFVMAKAAAVAATEIRRARTFSWRQSST